MIEVRSYRRVFDLERRIYSVDQLRLNPGGIPVRGVVYFLAIVAISVLAAGLPVFGWLARALPWYLRDVALPAGAAALLSVIRLEGRSSHLAVHALVRYWLGPRRLAGARRCQAPGGRWHPWEVVILPDGSDSRLRHLRYTGPGAVLISIEHERRGRAREHGSSGRARPGVRAALTLVQARKARRLEHGQVISLAANARLRVRAGARGDR
ncbi:MAG TPA: hypothetical protein VMF09_10035 [Solirubrobacteraceae bacterium]|nr:hypothetical protein [Solirubrobacteraceae bacterium]